MTTNAKPTSRDHIRMWFEGIESMLDAAKALADLVGTGDAPGFAESDEHSLRTLRHHRDNTTDYYDRIIAKLEKLKNTPEPLPPQASPSWEIRHPFPINARVRVQKSRSTPEGRVIDILDDGRLRIALDSKTVVCIRPEKCTLLEESKS